MKLGHYEGLVREGKQAFLGAVIHVLFLDLIPLEVQML